MDVQTVGSAAIVFGAPVVAAAVVTPFILRSFLSNQRRNSNHLPPVPEVPGVPLFGNLLQLKEKKPFKTFSKWAETYGLIYSIKTGATSMVVVNSSHLAKEAMVTKFESISTRKLSKALNILTDDKSMVAMSDYDDFHKTVKRNILTSVLGPAARKKNRVHRDVMAENVLNQLQALAARSSDQPVNLRKIFQSQLFSLALKQALGKDIVESIYVNDLGATMTKEEIFKVLVTDPTMGAIEVDWRDFFPYLKWIPNTRFDKKIEQMYIRREAVMNVLIQHQIKRIDSGERLNSYIDYLLLEAEPLTKKQLLMSVWESIIEASDTTMITTEWAMYELAKNPKKQACLYEEIQNVWIRKDHGGKVVYVHENTELGGYHVPAGTQVAINIYGCNMDRETWENPEDWNPERFLNDNVPIDLLRTMSFGAGKRVCAGATQVMLIACMGIGRMVQEFEWRLKDDTDEDVNTISITTHKLNPMLAVIKPRI